MKNKALKVLIGATAASTLAMFITIAVYAGDTNGSTNTTPAASTNAPVSTNAPEPTITLKECNQRVAKAYQNGFVQGVRAAEQARLNDQLPALVQRAAQTVGQGPQQ